MTDEQKLTHAVEALTTISLPVASSDDLKQFSKKIKPLRNLSDDIVESKNVECESELNLLNTLHFFQKAKTFFQNVNEAYTAIFNVGEGKEMHSLKGIKGLLSSDIPLKVGQHCLIILEFMVNITDQHEGSQKACGQDGFITFLFEELLPMLSNINWGKGTLREEMLDRSMDILYNCCKISSNFHYYHNANAVDILVNLRNATSHLKSSELNVTALLTLGYLIDDKNNDKIVSGKDAIQLLLKYLESSLKTSDHTHIGFHTEELATGLSHIAVNDENKENIVKEGGVAVLAEYLEKAMNDQERISCCNALWMLCFSAEGRSHIEINSNLMKKIEELTHSKDSNVSSTASGVLWQLKQTDHHDVVKGVVTDGKRGNQHGNAISNGHIMLSYQWDSQPMVKKIANYLMQQGYKVWIDIRKMQGNIMDAMAKAVEDSDILIICVSRKYKTSAKTRAEADYAFQLNKPFIPLAVEEGYSPDGWLGLLLGSQLRIPFASDNDFETSVGKLCETIGERCLKVNSPIIPEEEVAVNTCSDPSSDEGQSGNHKSHAIDAVDTGTMRSDQTHRLSDEKRNEISQWDNAKVVDWIKEIGVSSCIYEDALKRMTGIHLIMLHKLSKENSKYYYTDAMPQIGISNILDILSFTYHLENILKL